MVRRSKSHRSTVAEESADSLTPELVTAEDFTFNLMVYGDAGVGKTMLSCSAQDHPSMANVLLGDIEGGTLSIAHRGDIHKVTLTSTDDCGQLAWDLAQGKYSSVRTFVLDNGTELQTKNLEEIVQAAISGGRNEIKDRVGRKVRDRTIDDIWQEDYGRSTVQLKRLFRFCRDLPINFILTAHAKRVYPKVPDGTDLKTVQPIAIMPSLTNKLMESTMGYMDFVWCMEQDADEESATYGQRFLITANRGEYRCKTRGPRFFKAIGDIIQDPNLPEIYDTFIRTSTTKPKRKKVRS